MTLDGLALERTSLAWSRTALAFSGVAALQLRGYVETGVIVELVAALVEFAAAAVVAVTARRRRRRVDRVAHEAYTQDLERLLPPGTPLLPAANLSVRVIGVMAGIIGFAALCSVILA